MTTIHTTLRTIPSFLVASLLAVGAMGCDGAIQGSNTTATQALTATLDSAQPAMSFDVTIRVNEPMSEEGALYERVLDSRTVETGFEFKPFFPGAEDLSNIGETFWATAQALADNEYIAEKDVRDAVNTPFFATVPLSFCGGSFPCDLTIRIDIERVDFASEEPLTIDCLTWVGSEHFDFEIVDVKSFPMF